MKKTLSITAGLLLGAAISVAGGMYAASMKIATTSVHTITYEYTIDNPNNTMTLERAVITFGLGSDNKLYYWNASSTAWELWSAK